MFRKHLQSSHAVVGGFQRVELCAHFVDVHIQRFRRCIIRFDEGLKGYSHTIIWIRNSQHKGPDDVAEVRSQVDSESRFRVDKGAREVRCISYVYYICVEVLLDCRTRYSAVLREYVHQAKEEVH